MNFVELILTVCTLAQPNACDERRLMLESATGSTSNCMMQAMPYIAQWSGDHPNVQVTRWRCVTPGAEGNKI
ncbi:hypothetical protein [Methylocystis iwaonis]|uniref:Uncharacterized protein n=2 Tax=Methylocystis TaxID=133 RepID=A0ABN6VL37_9HYPH|nr:hypothetical protein [Methylocystis iwaonis]BDV35087.1 hypothetical protein SS37A_26160 [Methylocystis iwaonis]